MWDILRPKEHLTFFMSDTGIHVEISTSKNMKILNVIFVYK
jgi:hypothetical protein